MTALPMSLGAQGKPGIRQAQVAIVSLFAVQSSMFLAFAGGIQFTEQPGAGHGPIGSHRST